MRVFEDGTVEGEEGGRDIEIVPSPPPHYNMQECGVGALRVGRHSSGCDVAALLCVAFCAAR